jgi:hypothetical protein
MAPVHESMDSSLNEIRPFPHLRPRFKSAEGVSLVSHLDNWWSDGRLRGHAGRWWPQAHGGAPWAEVASSEFHFGRYGARRLGFLALNRSEGKGILTRGSLMAGWAPRWLASVAGFVLLHGSVHIFSNGPLVNVRSPTVAVASARACRGLQLRWESVESRAHVGVGFAILHTKIYRGSCSYS